jgi:hypothetical protein
VAQGSGLQTPKFVASGAEFQGGEAADVNADSADESIDRPISDIRVIRFIRG